MRLENDLGEIETSSNFIASLYLKMNSSLTRGKQNRLKKSPVLRCGYESGYKSCVE